MKPAYGSQHKGSSNRSSSYEQTPNASSGAYNKGSSKGEKRKRTSQSLAKVTVMMTSGKTNGEAIGHGTNVGKVIHRSAAPNMLYKNIH